MMGRKKKPDPEKNCSTCGAALMRKKYSGRMEDRAVFLRRKYCDLICSALGREVKTPSLAALRKKSARLRGKACQDCGTTEQIGIHHKDSNPANNASTNLMTLCAGCHTRWHWQNGKRPWKRRGPCATCGAPAKRQGYCQKHWQRYQKYGDPLLTKIKVGSHYVLHREAPGAASGLTPLA